MPSRTTRGGDVYTPAYQGGTTSSFYVPGATGMGALLGMGFAETAGSTAAFRLHDGVAAGASNMLTALVTLNANQSGSDWYGPQGIAVATGIYVERVNGNTEVVVYGN